MQVVESHKIKNLDQQNEIIDIMFEYTSNYESNYKWDRTRKSLLKEWGIHNTLSSLGLFREQADDCDFNNEDEGRGWIGFTLFSGLGWYYK